MTAEAGEHTVTVTWKAPNGDFSAIDKYRVTLSGTNAPAPVETNGTSVIFAIENNTIVDGASYKATVQSHNKVNWSQPSKQSGDAKPWGKPDAPAVTLTNNDTRGTVTVESVGNTRNAGCKSIELSGDVTMTMSCSGSESFDIPERNLNTKEYVVEAIVIGKKATRSDPVKVTFTPRYTVEKPERVSVSGDKGICKVTWKMRGHADGYTVHASGFDPYEAGASERSHDFMMAPWQSCTSASVMQRFKGVTSKPTEGSASPAYVNKQKAGIQAPQLRWSSTDTDTIDITGGTVNMYGQSGKTMITFTAEGKSYDVPWAPSDRTLNVNNILPTGADYVWKARVVGDDPALSNETSGERLKDADRYQPDPTPSPSASPITNPSKNPSTTLGVTPSTSRNVRSNRTNKALAGTVTVNTARRESAPVYPMTLFQHRQQIQALGLRAWRTPSTKEQRIPTMITQQQGAIIP